ncbi:hypothetical protein, partial [Salinisphaera orenii]|uniref:hypothetical protein n=1 Tax=Salinisphaera orenii TaxID=856731 RepID=UPI001C83256C
MASRAAVATAGLDDASPTRSLTRPPNKPRVSANPALFVAPQSPLKDCARLDHSRLRRSRFGPVRLTPHCPDAPGRIRRTMLIIRRWFECWLEKPLPE